MDACHFLYLASVNIAERELIEHILIGMHIQFLLKQFGTFGTDPLQIANVGLQQIDFHAAKI